MNKQRAIEVLRDIAQFCIEANNEKWTKEIIEAEKVIKEEFDKEKRVYIINTLDSEIWFNDLERNGNYEKIMTEAEALETVYSLQRFQDACNNKELDLSNSFILIK